jgi:MoaA/NifB/PqqE/SkfB family radical SAM enzyme
LPGEHRYGRPVENSVFVNFKRLLRRAFPASLPRSRRILPQRVRLEASSFCQLRCPSCPTTSGAIHPAVGSGFLRFEDFRRLAELNPLLKWIEISNYGEIFLNPELIQILEYARNKGITITIENGVNLNHARTEALEALVQYQVAIVTCSIDGASPETYRTYRVRGDFDAVIRNIKTINAYKAQHGSVLPHLVWQFVVFGHNEHEIPVARKMAQDLGMEFRTKLTWDSEFSPVRDAQFVRTQSGLDAVTREEFEERHDEKYASAICLQLWDDPQINWDGKMLGCCRNFWGDFGGNAFTDGLTESVNSERMTYAREMLTGRRPPREDIPCTTCEMYEAMRARSRFIAPRDNAGTGAGADSCATLHRKMETFIGEVDAGLAACDTLSGEARTAMIDSLKRRMISPHFLADAGDCTQLPSPVVSVILPTRNRARPLAEAIASVQAQSFKDWELIVVDDGSSDDTAATVSRLLSDRRIRFVTQPATGHSAARNHGLRMARGALVAYLDSDNLWYRHFLKAAVVAMAENPVVDCIYGALDSDAHDLPHSIFFDRFDRSRLLRENFVDLNTFVHRRTLVESCGGFDESLTRFTDWDLVLRMTHHKPAMRVPVLAARYRVLDDQRISITTAAEPNYEAIRRKWRSPAA